MGKGKKRRAPVYPTQDAKMALAVKRTQQDVTLEWNGAQAPQPHANFTSDFVDVLDKVDGISLIFGKSHPYSGRVDHIVEVIIARHVFASTIWPTIEGEFLGKLKTHCNSLPALALKRPEGLGEAEFMPMRANLARVSYAGEEAVIDFHLFSTHDISAVLRGIHHGETIDITPILRVLLPPPLLLHLLEGCMGVLDKEGSS